MKLKFDEITSVPRTFTCENTGWCIWPDDKTDCDIKGECTVFRKDKQTVVFEGKLLGSFTASCDRCGCVVDHQIEEDFSYSITTKEEEDSDLPETEFSLDDLMIVYTQDPIVDVDMLLTEQADLAMPMTILCSDGCKGLCLGCGARLNEEECQCDPGECDSPFAVLKKLSQS